MMGHKLQGNMSFGDLKIAIENKKGSVREWVGQTKMKYPYGYIHGIKGNDGEGLDVYIGPNKNSQKVFIVHQRKAPDFKVFDEDKVMLGFNTKEQAKKAYLGHYTTSKFFGSMTEMSLEEFQSTIQGKKKLRMIKAVTVQHETEPEKRTLYFGSRGTTVGGVKQGTWDEPMPESDAQGRERYARYKRKDWLRNTGTYVDGKKHGFWTEGIEPYDDTHSRHFIGDHHISRGNYSNGVREGLWEIYDPSVRGISGEHSVHLIPYSIGNYHNGEKHGVWNSYQRSGKYHDQHYNLIAAGVYNHGNKHGTWYECPGGNPAIYEYVDGVKHGKGVRQLEVVSKKPGFFLGEAQPRVHSIWEEGLYVNGNKHGPWDTFRVKSGVGSGVGFDYDELIHSPRFQYHNKKIPIQRDYYHHGKILSEAEVQGYKESGALSFPEYGGQGGLSLHKEGGGALSFPEYSEHGGLSLYPEKGQLSVSREKIAKAIDWWKTQGKKMQVIKSKEGKKLSEWRFERHNDEHGRLNHEISYKDNKPVYVTHYNTHGGRLFTSGVRMDDQGKVVFHGPSESYEADIHNPRDSWVSARGNYNYGKKHGPWEHYNKDGSIQEIHYDDGKEVERLTKPGRVPAQVKGSYYIRGNRRSVTNPLNTDGALKMTKSFRQAIRALDEITKAFEGKGEDVGSHRASSQFRLKEEFKQPKVKTMDFTGEDSKDGLDDSTPINKPTNELRFDFDPTKNKKIFKPNQPMKDEAPKNKINITPIDQINKAMCKWRNQ